MTETTALRYGTQVDIDRRSFIFASGAFAASVAGGVPAPPPRLKVGIVSDTHIQDEASARHFEKALRYFRDCGVDAVMHVGDISDWGLVSAWRYAAEAWERVFPGDKMPDGRKVVKLFTTGNHDFEGIKYWDQKEEMLANGYSEAELLVENGIERQWERFFGEKFEPVTRKRVNGYDFITTHWNHRGDIAEWMSAHGGELDRTKPFFFFQHGHRRTHAFVAHRRAPDMARRVHGGWRGVDVVERTAFRIRECAPAQCAEGPCRGDAAAALPLLPDGEAGNGDVGL